MNLKVSRAYKTCSPTGRKGDWALATKRSPEKSPNLWKLHKNLWNNPQGQEETEREIRKYFEVNKNATTYRNGVGGDFTALSGYLRKGESLRTNDLRFYLKKPEKEEPN